MRYGEMKWWLACAALAGGLMSTRGSAAADVRWLGPPGCTDARGTLEEAERLLGRPLSAVNSLDFEVRITDDDGKWKLKLGTVERASGDRRERELVGESCDEVTAAAAVALAMVVSSSEPAPATTDAEPAPAEAFAAEARSPSPTRTAPPPASSPPPKPDPAAPTVSASLAVAGDAGALPSAAPGGEVAASLDRGPFRLTALGTLLAGSQRDALGKGADFQLLVGALLACGRRPMGPTVAAICIGAELGELSGEGAGVRNPRAGASLWWAPRLDLGLALPFSRNWSVFGRVGATLPRIRRDFVLGETVLVHRPGSVTGRLAIGVELGLM
jgi:hypothetical protein